MAILTSDKKPPIDKKNTESISATSPSRPKAEPAKAKDEYFELRLPKIRFADSPLSPLWVILLLISAFLLGMQTAKLTYIEKEMAKAAALPSQQPQVPSDPGKPALGAKVEIGAGTLPILGKKNAKVTMIEFSDFQCPFCERFNSDTFQQLKKDYIDTGKVQFSFRHLPLDIHSLAPIAAEASECANDQDKFWEYHDVLFGKFNDWTTLTLETLPPKLEEYAGTLGLNTSEFSTCLSSGKYTEKVTKDKNDGQAAGATGTPSFFINGKILVGAMPYATFKTLLDQELK